MTGAIWGIIYDLPVAGRDAYLAWFHDVHMPEKLARPGYRWAAHYEVTDADGCQISSLDAAGAGGEGHGYIALFGGTDTQVFLDPSPAQIKPRQTPLTREMMAVRIGQRSFIAAEEWRAGEGDTGGHGGPGEIALLCCNAPGNDEAFGAWCVQHLKPSLMDSKRVRALTKLLTATGPVKHAVLVEAGGLPGGDIFDAPDPIERMSGAPYRARRIA